MRGTSIRVLLCCGVVLCLGACKAKVGLHGGTAAGEDQDRSKPVPIARLDCGGGTEQVVDVNNDQRPDIRHVLKDAKRICTEIDMNFDGKVDVIRFYEADGETTTVEQHDFDFDGKVDEQSFLVAGAIKRRELDTNFDGLVDTWMWCSGPYVERSERARRQPGRVDTWETYENGVAAEIKYDENNDGRPEKWEMFKGGALTETRYDTNEDGEPDTTEAVVALGDAKDKAVSCDGTAFPIDESSGGEPGAPAAGEDKGTSGGEKTEDGAADEPTTEWQEG